MQQSGFLRSWVFLPVLVFVFVACSGGSCSTCEGCGIAPIPGGFPTEQKIANSVQVRLSESGIGFIEDNIEDIIGILLPGGLDFAIPRTETTLSVPLIGDVDVVVCPDSDCNAHGEVHDFELTPATPNRLQAHIQVVLDTRDTGGGRRAIPIDLRGGCTWLGCVVDTTCQADLDTRGGSRPYVGLVADIDLVAEDGTRPARGGYTKIVVSRAELAEGEGIEEDDIDFGSCSGLSGALINLVAGFLTGTIVDQLEGQVNDLIQGQIEDQLCTQRGDYGCPTGTFAVPDESPGSICRYGSSEDDTCVPILLGTDGRGDLGQAFLGGFSPGVHSPGQLLLASGGDGESVNNGASLFFFGGFMGTDRTFTMSPAHNACVPIVEPPPIPTIPRVDAFRGNTIPGSGTPVHVGIGISEQYMNYTGYGVFDSGMLCLGVNNTLSQQLSTGLFSLLIRSLGRVAFPSRNAPIALALRPQQPPIIEVGAGTADDPLLGVTLNDLEMDFYVFSTERYVRFMTYRADLTLPINLRIEGGEIVPEIGDVVAMDSSVTNSELLEEDPVMLAGVLEDLIQMFAGMITGGINPIALPSLMGFDLQVPEGGLVGVSEGGEEFLGVFANLALAPMALTAAADTRLQTSGLTLDPEALRLEAWGDGELPAVTLSLDAGGGPDGSEYEYSVRLDGMQWSEWTRDRQVVLSDRGLLFQARHVIEARARVVGAAESTDPTPAWAEVLVDVTAPEVWLEPIDAGVAVRAADVLSPVEAMRFRIRPPDGEWSAWRALTEETVLPIAVDGTMLDVEVMDEAGNVGSVRAPLIRGRPNPAAAGCACGVAGGRGEGLAGLALALLVVGLLVRRRRA